MSSPLLTPIQYIKGVGPALAKVLAKLEIRVVKDLLYHFPLRYIDRSRPVLARELEVGKSKTFIGTVLTLGPKFAGRRRMFELVLGDQTGVVSIVWFHFNEKFLRKKFKEGSLWLVTGDCQFFGGVKQFTHPDLEAWDETATDTAITENPFIPVYPLTEGLYQKTLRKIIQNTCKEYLSAINDNPLAVRDGEVKLGLAESIQALHSPPRDSNPQLLEVRQTPWHQRVYYDQLFYLQLGLTLKKRILKKETGFKAQFTETEIQTSKQAFPFQLTNAQERVVKEVLHDVESGELMHRLLQGDVGSGKTAVAFVIAALLKNKNFQTALMAPTEILAEQHFYNFSNYVKNDAKGIMKVALLTGSTKSAERKKILADLLAGNIHCLIGTHALIEDEVIFNNLGLVIVDEQHRFGVMQRARLLAKAKGGHKPHLLAMTATPIPRTLSMTLYGELDVSIINELPKGRQPVKTKVVFENQRNSLYQFINKELLAGRQAYVVCPLIEESEKSDLKDAIQMSERLTEVFKDFNVGLLHGKMKATEKEAIMQSFKKGGIHLLVSTTVIEVGVDVPNASVMVIEHAERFGLSQLHQLRGRVGRGASASFCFLVASYARSEESRFRLNVMEETNDGFKIAEEDLKLRGPGDFLGTRQSGLPDFGLAALLKEEKLLNLAQKRVDEILAVDPHLTRPEYQSMRDILKERWGDRLALADVS